MENSKNTERALIILVFVFLFSLLSFSVAVGELKIEILNNERRHDAISPDTANCSTVSNPYSFLKTDPIVSDPLVEEINPNLKGDIIINPKRDAQEYGLSNKLKMRILELHNIYRGNVTPPAGNMAFMEWDENLEHLAKLWADTCNFNHGRPPGTSYPDLYVQNLYIGTDPTGLLGVWMWYEEYLDYNFHNQSCPEDKICGHYLSMSWAASNKLGCAIKKCGYKNYLVCHYSPGALRGMPIYDVAKPCSQCPINPGTLCYNNLCMTREQCGRNPKICESAKCNLKCHNCGRLNKTECLCHCVDGWDSLDCSYQCADAHDKCGKNPGFPNKATCSWHRYDVANVHCRKMCNTCNSLQENADGNNACCFGILCPKGYVLDFDRKPCRCALLCPGPKCDYMEGKGAVLISNFILVITVLAWHFCVL